MTEEDKAKEAARDRLAPVEVDVEEGDDYEPLDDSAEDEDDFKSFHGSEYGTVYDVADEKPFEEPKHSRDKGGES